MQMYSGQLSLIFLHVVNKTNMFYQTWEFSVEFYDNLLKDLNVEVLGNIERHIFPLWTVLWITED